MHRDAMQPDPWRIPQHHVEPAVRLDVGEARREREGERGAVSHVSPLSTEPSGVVAKPPQLAHDLRRAPRAIAEQVPSAQRREQLAPRVTRALNRAIELCQRTPTFLAVEL